jgi:hypothetical protein
MKTTNIRSKILLFIALISSCPFAFSNTEITELKSIEVEGLVLDPDLEELRQIRAEAGWVKNCYPPPQIIKTPGFKNMKRRRSFRPAE